MKQKNNIKQIFNIISHIIFVEFFPALYFIFNIFLKLMCQNAPSPLTQIISRKVGHSSVQTTDRVYSHFFEDEFKNVPNVMEDFLAAKAN